MYISISSDIKISLVSFKSITELLLFREYETTYIDVTGGVSDGTELGINVGCILGWSEGLTVGIKVGSSVGIVVGFKDGSKVGWMLGSLEGIDEILGSIEGSAEGLEDGFELGWTVGTNDEKVGIIVIDDGLTLGMEDENVGKPEGLTDGASTNNNEVTLENSSLIDAALAIISLEFEFMISLHNE